MPTDLIDECRQAFEKWCNTPPNELRTGVYADDGEYIMMETRIAWCAWQSAWNQQEEKINGIMSKWHSDCPV